MVVDTTVKAKRTNIVLCESSGARLVFGGVSSKEELLSADLKVLSQNGSFTHFLAEANITPLFRARRIRDPFFGPPRVEIHRGEFDGFDEFTEQVTLSHWAS